MTTALQLFKTAMEEQPDAMAGYFGDAYARYSSCMPTCR